MRCAWRSIVAVVPPQCFSYGRRRSGGEVIIAAAKPRYSTKPVLSEAGVPAITAEEKKAAGSALVSYLRGQGLGTAEVLRVRRAAPSFCTKLTLLARDRDSQAPSDLLRDGTLNAAEAVLESIGGDRQWVEEAVLGKMDTSHEGVRRLVELVHCFQKAGVPGKEIWRLFDSNALLWRSAASEVEEGIARLELGNKELPRLLQRCPQLVGCNSESLLRGIVAQLQQIGLGQENVYSLLMLFQPIKTSVRPVTEILCEHGVSKEDAWRCLESEAFFWLTRVNAVVSIAKSWFLENGVEERVFWKLMLQSTKDVYRSREALSTQLGTLTRYGMSQSEALELLIKHSHFLVWNDSVLQQKLDYLVNSMGYPIQVLLSQPRYLTCSLTSKIKPRHQLLEWLENGAGSAKPGNLLFLFRSEDEFLRVYGKCHPNAVAVYRQLQQEAESGIEKQARGFAESRNDTSSSTSSCDSAALEAETNCGAAGRKEEIESGSPRTGPAVQNVGEASRVDSVTRAPDKQAAGAASVQEQEGTAAAAPPRERQTENGLVSAGPTATMSMQETNPGGGGAPGVVAFFRRLLRLSR